MAYYKKPIYTLVERPMKVLYTIYKPNDKYTAKTAQKQFDNNGYNHSKRTLRFRNHIRNNAGNFYILSKLGRRI